MCDTLGHIDSTCSIELQFFGNRARKANSDQATFDETCKVTEHGLTCMDEYANKCLAAQPAMFAKTVLGSLKDHYNKRCKDADYGVEFREHNKCFEDPATFEQFHQCEDKFYYRMLTLQSIGGDLEQNIRSACCIFHTFQKCIRDLNVQLCHDKNAHFWDDLIGDVSGEAVDLFCADLKTADMCIKNFPSDIWMKIDGPVAAMDPTALKDRSGKFKSMVITLLDMLSQYSLNPSSAK